jgi:inactivated superfamily I helicase
VPYIPHDILTAYFPAVFFQSQQSNIEILTSVTALLASLKQETSYFKAVKAALLDQLRSLVQLFREKNINLDKKALPFFALQYMAGTRVPFEKAAEETDTEVMGFLETRLLDFETLYILSLNDDNLPGSNKTNSFIPYNLRKGFGLPTFEQFDGINAYHFYRLLKRAANIHLIYNNQMGDNASEKSRFIRQIEHDLISPSTTIREIIVTPEPLSPADDHPAEHRLQIKKTAEMSAALRTRVYSPLP